jgi:hypothetical protein
MSFWATLKKTEHRWSGPRPTEVDRAQGGGLATHTGRRREKHALRRKQVWSGTEHGLRPPERHRQNQQRPGGNRHLRRRFGRTENEARLQKIGAQAPDDGDTARENRRASQNWIPATTPSNRPSSNERTRGLRSNSNRT